MHELVTADYADQTDLFATLNNQLSTINFCAVTADHADENGFIQDSQQLVAPKPGEGGSTSQQLNFCPGVLRIAILSVAHDHEARSAVIQFPNM